jgi:glutaconate CoA-transferase, subunit B
MSESLAAEAEFLVRAARAFDEDRSVFTGFHWPVLAGDLAQRLRPGRFVQYFEAGFNVTSPPPELPTSTTDHYAFGGSRAFLGSSADCLLALAPRFDLVLLDAGTVDLSGRTNSTAIGGLERPRVRLPGGGGAADVADAARELWLLHGGPDPSRIQRAVEHVTAAPGRCVEPLLLTRWGTARLGPRPRLTELSDGPGSDRFVAHLESLGVDTTGVMASTPATGTERAAARDVLAAADRRGYTVARV